MVDFSEVSPSFSYLFSVVLLACIVALMAFVISLFLFNGPYVDGYYKTGTVLRNLWGTRPINPDFDVYGYLKANKPKKKKHRGWFKIITGNQKNAKLIQNDADDDMDEPAQSMFIVN